MFWNPQDLLLMMGTEIEVLVFSSLSASDKIEEKNSLFIFSDFSELVPIMCVSGPCFILVPRAGT